MDEPRRLWTAVLLLGLALSGPAAAFTYLFTHPEELRQLIGEPDRICRCP